MKTIKSINRRIAISIITAAAIFQGNTPILWSQQADDLPVANAPQVNAGPEISELEAWIEQLSESSLTKRRKAKEALVRADAAAIPLLAKAALSDKRELIIYSLEVLGTLMEKSPSDETRQAALATLKMLSESEQPSTADRAKQILASKSDKEIEAFPGWDDPKSGFAGGGGNNRSISVSSINGVKTIRVEEGGRVTTFQDEPRGAIRVTIEEGDDKKEFVAKSLQALKKKDAAAGALYQEQSNGVGGFPFGNLAGGFAGDNFGGNVGGNFGGNARGDQATKEMMIRQLEELKQRLADNPAMTQMLDAQIQTLKQK